MKKAVLLRHGESTWNKENLFTGWTDVELSEKGTQEAIEAGRVLLAEGYVFDVAYTSVLKRAMKTLWLALEQMDLMWIPIHNSWRLNRLRPGRRRGHRRRMGSCRRRRRRGSHGFRRHVGRTRRGRNHRPLPGRGHAARPEEHGSDGGEQADRRPPATPASTAPDDAFGCCCVGFFHRTAIPEARAVCRHAKENIVQALPAIDRSRPSSCRMLEASLLAIQCEDRPRAGFLHRSPNGNISMSKHRDFCIHTAKERPSHRNRGQSRAASRVQSH